MKRESLPSISKFIDAINQAPRTTGHFSNPLAHLTAFTLGPCNIEIAEDLNLAPDTVATAIAREYWKRGGDLSDASAVNKEIISVLENVERRHPGSLVAAEGDVPISKGIQFDKINLEQVLDGTETNELLMLLPFTQEDSLPPEANINIKISDVLGAITKVAHSDLKRDPVFTYAGGNYRGGDIVIDTAYTLPADYKEITADRVLCNRDNLFTSFFTAATFAADLYKYFLTKGLSSVFQTVLNSKGVPDNIKEVIINTRYKIIDLIDNFRESFLEDEDILNIIKNISENNEVESNEKLKKILDSRLKDRLNLVKSRSADTLSPSYIKEKADPTKDWEFLDIATHGGAVRQSMGQIYDASTWLYAGRKVESNAFAGIRQEALRNFLYKDQPITADQIVAFKDLGLVGFLLDFMFNIGRAVGWDWLQAHRYFVPDPTSYPRSSKSNYNSTVDTPTISTQLTIAALAGGSLDWGELQKEVNKAVAKCRLLQPHSKSSTSGNRSPFYLFVEAIGGTYDTSGMGSPEHTKKIKKILAAASKNVAAFAGISERSTPGDTVAYAMRVFSNDEAKMDAIYDIVDEAINACYDEVFGAADLEE